MNKYLKIGILLMLCLSCGTILKAQPEDDGFSSEYHKNNAGTIVFSNNKIPFQKEDVSKFKKEFNWGETIYTRNYLKRGMGKEYAEMGWELYRGKVYELLEVYVNDNLVASHHVLMDPKWTTFQSSFYPSDDDELQWEESGALWNSIDIMKPGKNNIKVKIFAAKGDRQKGNLVCEGSFVLIVKKEEVEKAKIPLFTHFVTKWSGNDAWTEWVVNFNRNSGSLKCKWSGSDAWKEWTFSIPGSNGTIKTKWSGNDAWNEWTYNGNSGTINIKTKWSGNDALYEWVISGSKGTLNAKTVWSGNDRWKEWIITGPKGNIKVKTKWSGDDAWKEWTITDNMPEEDIDLKFAAIFPCLMAGAVLK